MSYRDFQYHLTFPYFNNDIGSQNNIDSILNLFYLLWNKCCNVWESCIFHELINFSANTNFIDFYLDQTNIKMELIMKMRVIDFLGLLFSFYYLLFCPKKSWLSILNISLFIPPPLFKSMLAITIENRGWSCQKKIAIPNKFPKIIYFQPHCFFVLFW